jgi:hypothetical protein
MSTRKRRSIDLRSQDLTVEDMERFRETFLDSSKGGRNNQELIMFSAKAKPYQFISLDEFNRNLKSVPKDAEYFYYTLTLPNGDRCSLYLDPDRPARIVVEGSDGFVNELATDMERTFPRGSSRYKTQGNLGYFIIWGVVVGVAFIFILAYTLATGSHVNPFLVAWVLFISSLLGIYLSIAKSKEINPANTMALGKKRKRPMLDIFLHFITVALGIISVILVLLFVEFNL